MLCVSDNLKSEYKNTFSRKPILRCVWHDYIFVQMYKTWYSIFSKQKLSEIKKK